MKTVFREMRGDDLAAVLALRNLPGVRSSCRNPGEIEMEKHREWFYSTKQDRFVLEVEDQIVGVVTFQASGDEVEWSFYIDTRLKWPHLGRLLLGHALFEAAKRYSHDTKLVGWVKHDNTASKRLHLDFGMAVDKVDERNFLRYSRRMVRERESDGVFVNFMTYDIASGVRS